MRISFTKMQGTGNDFVVIDAISHPVALTREQIRRLCDRRFGVGCDQVLMVAPATANGVDFSYRIFNADGAEVEQCGNGARCFARFVRAQGLTAKPEITVQTLSGLLRLRLGADGQVTVNMGVPEFDPPKVPFTAERRAIVYDLDMDGTVIPVSVLSMGNPHAVHVVTDVDRAPVSIWGPSIEHHRRFPNRVNAGFMQVVDRNCIRLRVFERGVGETLACGSGACAAVVTGRMRGMLDENVEVTLPGGKVHVGWAGEGRPAMLTGAAETVFEGTIDLDDL